MELFSQTGDSIMGEYKTDLGQTAEDVGPEKGENPDYGIPPLGVLTCEQVDTGEESSLGEDITDAG